MAKINTSIRLEPDTYLMLRKIAKEEYGSESKKGYVIENALSQYQSQRLRPTEASAILSVTEQKIIERLDKRFSDIGKDMIERIGNLTAKSTYEVCLTSLLVEDVHKKAGFNKNAYELKRKEAAQRMKKRYDKEGVEEIGGVLEENEYLKEVNNNVNERLETATKVFGELKDQIKTLENDKQQLQEQLLEKDTHQKNLQLWVNQFTNHLTSNYSRLKNNQVLVEEFLKDNPVPKINA